MTGLDVPRTLADDLPDRVTAAFQASEQDGREAAMVALELDRHPATRRLALHLAIAQSYLRDMNTAAARGHLVMCDALCRSQRMARPQRAEVALHFSLLSRFEGRYRDALWYADTVKRSRAPDALLAGAYLAAATALRLSGQPLKSVGDLATAKYLQPGPEVQTAELLTWLQTDPSSVTVDVGAVSAQLPAPLRARLAWMLADQAIREQRPSDAAAWCQMAEQHPTAREELHFAPLAANLRGHQAVSPRTDKPRVRVETIERQGLNYLGQFLPVPGAGILLALLAYLIDRGHVESEQLAAAVLEPDAGSTDGAPQRLPGGRRRTREADKLSSDEIRARLDTQVRRHLTTLRHLLADATCVVTDEHVVFLDERVWTCDALEPGARTPPGQPWLPHVPGPWAAELRQKLARQRKSRKKKGHH